MLNPKGVFLDINPSSKRMVRGFLSRHYKLVFATMGVKYISKKLLIMQIKAFLKPTIGQEYPFAKTLLRQLRIQKMVQLFQVKRFNILSFLLFPFIVGQIHN